MEAEYTLLSLSVPHPQPARPPWKGCRAPAISLDPSLAFMPASRLDCYYPQSILKLSLFSLQTHSASLFQDSNTTQKVPFPLVFPISANSSGLSPAVHGRKHTEYWSGPRACLFSVNPQEAEVPPTAASARGRLTTLTPSRPWTAVDS